MAEEVVAWKEKFPTAPAGPAQHWLIFRAFMLLCAMLHSISSKIMRPLTLICSAILLLSMMAISNVIQLLFSPLSLISPRMYYDLNGFLAGSMWALGGHMFEEQNGVKVEVYGMNNLVPGESALVISNHRSFLDWVLIHSVSQRLGMINNCRYFVKDSIKHWPFLGWGMYLAGFVFLKRDWASDRGNIEKTFENIKNRQLPIHLICFVEGRRWNEKKLVEANSWAENNNFPKISHCLYPRAKGFVATVDGLRNSHVNHIYDLTLCFSHKSRGFGARPGLFEFLMGRMEDYNFKVLAERIDMAALPTSDEGLTNWLRNRFIAKDRLLQSVKDSISESRKVL